MGNKYLIVGANSTIAKHLIDRLSKEGHECVLFSRTPIESHHPSYEISLLEDDIAFPSIEGALHGIVYFPGTITLNSFENLKPEQFVKDFEINVLGAVKVLKQYLGQLKESNAGSIVMLSSVAARVGMTMHSSISTAKAGVEGFVRALSAELAPKIRVNAVSPSLTETELSKSLLDSDTKKEKSKSRHPMKRYGTPQDIANAIHYFLSDESSWVTGQILGVDGGLSSIVQLQ